MTQQRNRQKWNMKTFLLMMERCGDNCSRHHGNQNHSHRSVNCFTSNALPDPGSNQPPNYHSPWATLKNASVFSSKVFTFRVSSFDPYLFPSWAQQFWQGSFSTHLSWVAEVFGFVLLVHGDDPPNVFCFHQLQQHKSAGISSPPWSSSAPSTSQAFLLQPTFISCGKRQTSSFIKTGWKLTKTQQKSAYFTFGVLM